MHLSLLVVAERTLRSNFTPPSTPVETWWVTFSASVKCGHVRAVRCAPGARLILAGVPTSAGLPEAQTPVPTSPRHQWVRVPGPPPGPRLKGQGLGLGAGHREGGVGGATGAGPLVPRLALRAAGAGPAGGAAASPKARGRRGPAGCVGQVLRAHRLDVHGCVCTRFCAHVSRVPALPLHTCTHGSRPAPRRATLAPCSAESRAQAVPAASWPASSSCSLGSWSLSPPGLQQTSAPVFSTRGSQSLQPRLQLANAEPKESPSDLEWTPLFGAPMGRQVPSGAGQRLKQGC